jgi:hypothetical protein
MKITLGVKTLAQLDKVLELGEQTLGAGGYIEIVFDVADRQASQLLQDWSAPGPVAQSAPAPGPVVQSAPGVEPVQTSTDAKGVPWNENLHAARTGRTGGKNEIGEWKMRRGADRDIYMKWRMDHLPQQQPQQQPQPQQPQPQQPQPQPQSQPQQPAITAATYNPFAPVPAPTLEDPGEAAVAAKATELAQAGLLTPAKVNELMSRLGVVDNGALLKDPAVRPHVWQALQEIG